MLYPTKRLRALFIASLTLVSACASSISAAQPPGTVPKVKLGKPYQVAGQWYTPADDKSYDEKGLASWYGAQFQGRSTASGEIFDMNAVTGAHKTLPMPSFVEVTNLDNGRSITVRINDRGPFKSDRLLDVSRRGAQLLGFENKGTARVRVRRVFPTPRTIPVPASFASIELAMNTPPPFAISLLPAFGPDEMTSLDTNAVRLGDRIFVQVAVLRDLNNALKVAATLDKYGTASVQPQDGNTFNVRVGPFQSMATAEIIVTQVRNAGFDAAKVATTTEPIS